MPRRSALAAAFLRAGGAGAQARDAAQYQAPSVAQQGADRSGSKGCELVRSDHRAVHSGARDRPDPNSGMTLGLIPTWLITDDKRRDQQDHRARRALQPVFRLRMRGRIYAFPSSDSQWSTVAGAKERVESEFDLEYQTGRLRNTPLSVKASVVYDRSGTPRFYGIGNYTPESDESNYTLQQKFVQVRVGWNLNHALADCLHDARARGQGAAGDASAAVPSHRRPVSGARFGVGTMHENLSRVEIVYDTRDDRPSRRSGGAYVLYGGVAAQRRRARLLAVQRDRIGCAGRSGRCPRETSSPPTRRCATCRESPTCRSGVCRTSAATAACSPRPSRCAATGWAASTTAMRFLDASSIAGGC